MSLFESIYSQKKKSDNFWREINSENATRYVTNYLLFQSFTSFSYNGNAITEYELSLSTNSLYFNIEAETTVFGKIKWALIEGFKEIDSESTIKYGFTVIFAGKKYDFYTENEELLRLWLEHLSNVAIMTDFDRKFAILKHIDSGQFGKVFLCIDLETKDEYAVKKLRKESLSERRSLNQLYNEITILRKINHPNVVKLFSIYEDDEYISLIMEYVPYGNLLQRVQKKKKILEIDVIHFALHLIELLKFLHSNMIIHRDLKLENILMVSKTNDFEFKLADFGLSCYLDQEIHTHSGSPGYLAPELFRSEGRCTTKADMFSLGIILYTLLTGMPPFTGKNTRAIMDRNIQCKISFKPSLFVGISIEAQEFLKEVLVSDPHQRPDAEDAEDCEWLKEYKDSRLSSKKSTLIRHTFQSNISTNFTKSAEKYKLSNWVNQKINI